MKNPGRKLGQAGFTLIEILVALILISLLVAAVFPVVTQQARRADAPRLASDLTNIRTGVEVFNVNLRNRFPTGLNTLAHPVADTQLEFGTREYNASHVTRWDGPYIDAAVPADGTGSVISGFGGVIENDFVLYDVATGAATGGQVAATLDDAAFLAVSITGLDESSFVELNNLLDGDADDVVNNGRFTGKLRSPGASADYGQAYYLAVPFRP